MEKPALCLTVIHIGINIPVPVVLILTFELAYT